MKRLWPKSLIGQVLLAVAAALLIAQSISAVLLYRASDIRRDQAALNAVAFRLVADSNRNASGARDRRSESRDQRRGVRRRLLGENAGERLPTTMRLEMASIAPNLAGETRLTTLEEELKFILEREGVAAAELVVVRRKAADDAFIRSRPRLLRRVARADDPNVEILVAGLRLDGAQQWVIARGIKPPPQRGALATIILQTLLIYLLLVGLHFLLLRRITRPLAALTQRTEAFGQSLSGTAPLVPEGPEDVARLIVAHNAMEARIAGLLDEKDVMLGAIGHDLKTPLAALRVRIETVDDECERSKMAASIKDITRSLDDILSLARIGRASEPPEKTELSALVASIVEEFEDMEKPVTLSASQRIAMPVHVTWLRRGLRNLIDNALRYAGQAEVSLLTQDSTVIVRVDDTGPGIPEDALKTIAEPFTRGEASRNKQTGGAGLGLTLARAIAEQHGGTLALSNRAGGGLRAEIHLPGDVFEPSGSLRSF